MKPETEKKTLLDEFAMAAISGLALHQLYRWDQAADRGYQLAKEMMIARKKVMEADDGNGQG
jgi:hypothetical protein